jgi:hypothetical protein
VDPSSAADRQEANDEPMPPSRHSSVGRRASVLPATKRRATIKISAPSGQFTALSQGYWDSGCYYAAYGPGGRIYSYTIWQTFGSDGSKINYLPAPTYSATSDVAYDLTAHSNTHWWVNSTHKDAAAQGPGRSSSTSQMQPLGHTVAGSWSPTTTPEPGAAAPARPDPPQTTAREPEPQDLGSRHRISAAKGST